MEPTKFTEENDKLRGFPKRSKKQRKRKREIVEYDDREPEMCRNCKHFKKPLYHKPTNEKFPARCKTNEFEVNPNATCNLWSEQ